MPPAYVLAIFSGHISRQIHNPPCMIVASGQIPCGNTSFAAASLAMGDEGLTAVFAMAGVVASMPDGGRACPALMRSPKCGRPHYPALLLWLLLLR